MAGLNLSIPPMKLPNGLSMPMLGYGTGTAWFKNDDNLPLDQKLIDAAKTAIGLGYLHLDGAEVYRTEPELGAAIKQSKVARDKLFVTTKVLGGRGDIPSAIAKSLKNLQLDYVDLYLIHSPFDKSDEELQTAWKAMEEVKTSGKAKSIGVSNYLKPQLEVTLKVATEPPAVNQIEFHPYLQHGDLIAYHKEKNIAVQAFGPLTPITKATGGPLDACLAAIANKYAVSPGEILLRWCIEQDVCPITTSSQEQRLSDYLRVLTFKLTPRELNDISEIGSTHHFRSSWRNRFAEDDRT